MPFFEGGSVAGPSGGGGPTASAFLDVMLQQGESEVFGQLTGLSSAPTAIAGHTIIERDAGVYQAGHSYTFQPYELMSDGFKWRVAMGPGEYWPGPGPVVLRIFYAWSDT